MKLFAHRLQLSGVQAMLLSAFCFALMNVFVRLAPGIPTHEAVFFRALIMFLLTSITLWVLKIGFVGHHFKALFVRSFFGTAGLTGYFYTLKYMPLASAVTLQYISPIFSTLLAIPMLGERVTVKQLSFFGLALAGVAMVKGFDPRISMQMVAIALVSTFCSAVAYNQIRWLKGKEHPIRIVLYFAGVNTLCIAPYTLSHWIWPTESEWILMILMATSAHLAQLFLTFALQSDKIANITLLNYTGVIYALFFGAILFGESTTGLTIAGMALIIVGVVLSNLSRSQLKT